MAFTRSFLEVTFIMYRFLITHHAIDFPMHCFLGHQIDLDICIQVVRCNHAASN